MTKHLYYTNAKLCEFEAQIIERQDSERGPAIRLDRSAFYPTSGGQPHDCGTINDVAVLDVWEDENKQVWHLLAQPLEGERAWGQIDWERRFDHMQQHSGQHLLSAAFVRALEAPTTSFHLGSAESTIDLAIPDLTWGAALEVEQQVNRVVWENRPVEVHTVDQQNIKDIPLRKAPQVSGDIRVIWVPDYDASACGGTHVAQTGEIGLIKIVNLVRYKDGVRLSFLCGERARRDYQRVLSGIQATSARLSVHQDELGEAVERLQEEHKETRKALKSAHEELNLLRAEQLWQAAPQVDGIRRIIAHWQDRSFDEARLLASHLSQRPHTLALLAVSESKGLRLVCACSDDLPDLDAAAILRLAAEALGGRGGGSSTMAQGGAQLHNSDIILTALTKAAP